MIQVGWSRKEEQTLIKLKHEGLTFAEIGKRMNRTMNSAKGKYYWLRNPPDKIRQTKPWTPEEEQRVREMNEDGMDDCAIAEVLGRTRKSVMAKRRKIGLLSVNKKFLNRRYQENYKPPYQIYESEQTDWPEDMDFGPEINRRLAGEVTIDIRRTSPLKYAGMG